MLKKMTRAFFKPFIKITTLIYRMKVINKDKLPKEGPIILALNHRIYFDIFFIMSLYKGDEVVVVGKRDVKKNPIGRILVWAYDVILVDRDGSDTTPLKRMIRSLRNNKILIIFPEGTRQGLLKNEFKSGTTYVALITQVDIVPVGINGSLKVFGKDNYLNVGNSFNLSKMIGDGKTSKDKEEINRLTEVLKNEILNLVEDGFYDGIK